MKRYRIERFVALADDYGPADTLLTSSRDVAELVAGEWIALHPDSYVIVTVTRSGRRYRAILSDDYATLRFAPLFGDGVAQRSPEEYEATRVSKFVKHLDRSERRRQAKQDDRARDAEQLRRERAVKFWRGVMRPVVCLDNRKAFAEGFEAARFLGVKHQSLFAAIARGGKCCGLRWQYADVLLRELSDEKSDREDRAALRAAAEYALSLRERKEVQAVPRRRRARKDQPARGAQTGASNGPVKA
jgi:hypothetical protein